MQTAQSCSTPPPVMVHYTSLFNPTTTKATYTTINVKYLYRLLCETPVSLEVLHNFNGVGAGGGILRGVN